jgi:KaiC/GvpD/RAD55 family RecA-like ATPase
VRSLLSLSQLQEVPSRNLILLVGPPGSGKSTFCEQAILHNLAFDKPIIYVTTEYDPSKAEASLREKGLSKIEPCLLNFVDAYNETVGISVPDRPDTVHADCNDLSSIDIGISRLSKQVGQRNILLVFDSLTSPYLFNGEEILRFMTQTLSKFVARGNLVLACMDEGCGKEEDLGSMMSLSSGLLKIEVKEEKSILNVLKHPKVERTIIEIPTEKIWKERALNVKLWDSEKVGRSIEALRSGSLTGEMGQFAVNLFWLNFM